MLFICNFLCIIFFVFFTVNLIMLVGHLIEPIIDEYEEKQRQKMFMSKRDKFMFEMSYFKEKYKQFKLRRSIDERILSICYEMLCQGNVRFTIDCFNIIITKDVICGYKIEKLFDKRKLKKVIKYFESEPKYTYEKFKHLDHGKTLDIPTISVIREVQNEVRNNRIKVTI